MSNGVDRLRDLVPALRPVTKRAGVIGAIAGLGLLLVLALSAAISARSTASPNGASTCGKGQTINVLSWQTYHDLPWVQQFEKKTGIKVRVQDMGSVAEGLAKVTSNRSEYDIVLATSGWFSPYVDHNLLEPIDVSRLPNFTKNYHLGFKYQAFTTVHGRVYGVPYTWGTGPLAYVPAHLKGLNLSKYENSSGVVNDWNVLWDPALKGKVTLLDEAVDNVEPMVALALGYKDPFNLTQKQLVAFKKKLSALRPQIKFLASGDADQAQALASGEAVIGQTGGNYLAGQVKKGGVTLKVVNTLKQGVTAWADNYAVTKAGGARSPQELACVYKFMNYTYALPWQYRLLAQEGQPGILNYAQATSSEAKAHGVTKHGVDLTLIPDTRKGAAFYSKLAWLKRYPNVQEMLNIWDKFKLGIH
jgi:spermidine/putrescine-binding protein